MAYQVPRYKQQSTITKMLHALFTQGIPKYAAYKTEQKAGKEKQKQADKEFKQKETQMKLDFLTAMTKDRNPAVAGKAVAGLEELLGTAPYSAVMGQEKLRPRGLPQRGMLQPGRMQMGPQAGGVMTTRQPSMGEMVSGAEPVREHKWPYTEKEVKGLKTFEAGLKPEPKPQLGKTPEERQLDRDLDIVGKYAPYEDDEKQLRKMGVLEMVRSARSRLQKKAAYQRYANDADNYFDRMLNLYKGNQQKAKEETIKFIRLMGIEPSMLQLYLKER